MILIWKRELQGYLYTPVMYIFLIVYLSLSSIFFVIGNIAARSGNMLSLLSNMSYLWMLLTPVLTMRLLSAGDSGGDQLLYNSALPLSSIVIGKYLASVTVLLAAILLSWLYPVLIAVFGTLYWQETLAGYLGFFMLGLDFLAVDLLVASLTKTPVTALVAGFGVNLFIWLSDLLLKVVAVPGISGAAEAISLYRRLSPFLSGRIGLGDIVYNLTFAMLMLFFCVRILELRRWRAGL